MHSPDSGVGVEPLANLSLPETWFRHEQLCPFWSMRRVAVAGSTFTLRSPIQLLQIDVVFGNLASRLLSVALKNGQSPERVALAAGRPVGDGPPVTAC